jgi:hypothetical protein
MDREARKRLVDQALSRIDGNSIVAVPAEEFLAGNTDDGSFGRHMETARHIPVAEYAAEPGRPSAKSVSPDETIRPDPPGGDERW